MQKRKIMTITIMLILVVVGVGLTLTLTQTQKVPRLSKEVSSNTVPKYKKITPTEAQNIMRSGLPYILLDVRTEEEFVAKRIPGATLLPDYEIGRQAEVEIPDKGALILVYCRSGRRSANAAAELANMGYENVRDMGGIQDWPYETTGD